MEKIYQKYRDEEEVNLKTLLKTFLRNKNFIIYLTTIATSIAVIYSFKARTIWQGSFEVVVKTTSKQDNFSSSGNFNLEKLTEIGDSNTTQKYVLKSPFVLRPVYEYVKNSFEDNNEKKFNLSFNSWINTQLDINFRDDSNVLLVQYKNANKEFILDVLTRISKEYQQYSKKNKEKLLNQTILYLSEQSEIMKEKSLKSLSEYNKFSIENGLGDIDGFFDLSKVDSAQINRKKAKLLNNSIDRNLESSGAGQRFSKQFALLEGYQSRYTDLSAELTDKSTTLIQLKEKIKNLKEALKRPNEILIKYRELKKIATRDEFFLIDIEEKLQKAKLDKFYKPLPWELISTPTINDARVFPKRKRIVGLTLIFSALFSSILVLIKEKFSKNIYDLEEFLDKINFKFLDKLFTKNNEINTKIIKKDINNLIKNEEKISLIGIINFSNINLDSFFKLLNKDKVMFYEILNFKDIDDLEKYPKIIVFLQNQCLDKNQLNLLNHYQRIFDNKFIGWYWIESQEI